jgi:4-amino-4-deoxy-L-arabinose transferase-like glycosyltransferase
MRLIPIGVAVVAAALYFIGLGAAPFVDPPEGFHAEIGREMGAGHDWVTPRLNGVRYFDKPPLLYWLMSASFAVAGPTPAAGRFWSALAAVGCAAVTAWLGMLLGGPRMGLLAGLMVAANMGFFLFGRFVKPDLVFILFLTLAYAGFTLAYLGRGWWALALFYAALGGATLAKDILGAAGPVVVVAAFLLLTRERPWSAWFPWWGVLLFAVIVVPWYGLVEVRNRGFLWYTIVDNHVLNFVRQRIFPDEDVPLGSLEFLVVTILAFLPWVAAVPWALARVFRPPWPTAVHRLWLLFGLWVVVVIGFFTLSPFKLPHYGLPAIPAFALLAARVWEEAIAGSPGAVSSRTLLVPPLLLFAAVAVAFGLAWADRLPIPPAAMSAVDVTARNFAARGQRVTQGALEPFLPVLAGSFVVFALGTVGMAVAVARRAAGLGAAVAFGAVIAFLPLAGEGMAEFARIRSAQPIAEALVKRLGPADLVIHEGTLENSGSVLLALDRPVRVVDGLQSNLAFGATFPEARGVFWDTARLQAAWQEPGRRFLISVVGRRHSVVHALPPGSVHLIAEAGGRRLYSNVGE